MERVSLQQDAVRDLSKKFVPILIDSDREEHIRAVMVHRVEDLPTMIFFTPRGTRLFELPYRARFNARAVEHYMHLALKQSERNMSREDALLKRAADAPESLEASDELEKFYADGFRFEDAYEQARHGHALAERLGKPGTDRRMADLLFYDLKLRNFQRAGGAIERFLQQHPDSKYREKVEYYRGLKAFYGETNLDKAAKIWEEQLNRWPNGRWAGKGRRMLGKSRKLQKDRAKLGDDFPKQWGGK